MLWHYTVGIRLASILADGLIRPAIAGVRSHERPGVWFSADPVWEPTANKSIADAHGRILLGDKASTEHFGRGLYRIAVAPETAPTSWREHRATSGITRKEAGLEAIARKRGSRPDRWFIAYQAVPWDKWLDVERWTGTEWIPADAK